MAQSVFPTDAELDDFETNYAGPNTRQLEKLRKAFNGSDANRNNTCLICLQEVDLDDSPIRTFKTCETRARVTHTACCGRPREYSVSPEHCLLCQRRGWHVYDPQATNGSKKGSDDWSMKRAARKALWNDAIAFAFIPRSFDGLKDDGSLQCDRQLFLALGIAKQDKMLFCTNPVAVEDGDEVVVKIEGIAKKRKTGHA